jgi:hypothetical protein
MSDKKSPHFVIINATAAFVVQLDSDIYTNTVKTAVGITSTKPGNTVKLFPTNIRYLLASGLVGVVKKKASRGSEPNIKTRDIKILCETDKLDTANSALKGVTVALCNGATTPTWTLS